MSATPAARDRGEPCPGCENERTQVFQVDGLCCAAEVDLVEGRLRALPGVCSAWASAVTRRATVVHTLPDGAVEEALRGVGFEARLARLGEAPRASLAPTLASAILTGAGFALLLIDAGLARLPFLVAILAGGLPIARRGVERARQRALDMNALMTVAVLGAMAIGEWAEGASTVALFSLAQALEGRSLERARRAIAGLVALSPEQAAVRREGRTLRVSPAEVRPGETLVVAAGERIALDGVVVDGRSDVDQSPLTGESQPAERGPGDDVLAGSINGRGVLSVRVTRPAAETTLARLIRRVEEAQASRAPTQDFVDRFAAVYTPAVVALAVCVAALPPLLGLGPFADWLYRALVLLVIACPCALVISTPVSIVSALTAASRRGTLVKGGAHLEAMGRLQVVAFDKTGTLTLGRLAVTDVVAAPGRDEGETLAVAAALEANAGHPLGEAIVSAARERGVAAPPAEDVHALPGRGVRGRIAGREAVVGSHRLFDERGLCDHRMDQALERLEGEGKTAILVGRPGDGLIGALAVSDAIRPEAREALAALHGAGVACAMLTGDNRRTAEAIASAIGVEDWSADLLPDDKVSRVRALGASREVAMVGDGVNDAPALASASVGIAMGARGADAALETADVVLMAEDLRRIPETIRLGRAAHRVIRQNVALALGVKASVLLLALSGLGSLWAAIGADMGASLLVIGNGLRLLHWPVRG
ncbi:MAG TPA: cation-translocating P-type ATPase [Vicinamibacteria bacterium]|nr:cation-translocating P-type ATPase [Vicinamibacteria bacterium]